MGKASQIQADRSIWHYISGSLTALRKQSLIQCATRRESAMRSTATKKKVSHQRVLAIKKFKPVNWLPVREWGCCICMRHCINLHSANCPGPGKWMYQWLKSLSNSNYVLYLFPLMLTLMPQQALLRLMKLKLLKFIDLFCTLKTLQCSCLKKKKRHYTCHAVYNGTFQCVLTNSSVSSNIMRLCILLCKYIAWLL